MRSITLALTISALFGLASRPAQAGDTKAGDPPNRTARVETLVRGLEVADAAARAKAAAELGTMFPEGALAVPVLVDASGDDDASVRKAAVASLRRLGRAGVEAIVKQFATMSDETRKWVGLVGCTLSGYGRLGSPVEVAKAIEFTAKDATDLDATWGAILAAAAAPSRLDLYRPDSIVDLRTLFAIMIPWASSPEPGLAEAASAALAVWGRAMAAEAPWDAVKEADLATPDTLAPLLSDASLPARWMGWCLVAEAPPHGDKTAAAVVAQWDFAKDRKDLKPFIRPETIEMVFVRDLYRSMLRSVGPRAGARLADASARRSDETPATTMQALAELGRADDARKLFDEQVRDHGKAMDAEFVSCMVAAARLPSLLPRAAKALAPWFDQQAREMAVVASFARDAYTLPDADAKALVAIQMPRPTLDVAAVLLRAPPDAVAPASARTAAANVLMNACRAGDLFSSSGVYVRAAIRTLGPAAQSIVRTWVATIPGVDDRVAPDVIEACAACPKLPESVLALAPLLSLTPSDKLPPATLSSAYGAAWPRIESSLHVLDHETVYSISRRGRLAAIDATGRVEGNPAKAKALLEPLGKDADPQVRCRVARALRRLALAK